MAKCKACEIGAMESSKGKRKGRTVCGLLGGKKVIEYKGVANGEANL